MRGIGRMSRESGLTVSALRFYDGAGLLCPAHVDPHSGYRFYAPEQVAAARLVAVLRRVGMPMAGIRDVLERRHDAEAVDALLAGHVRSLEDALADARRVLSAVPSLLAPLESPVPTTVTVPARHLDDALAAVRFAAGDDPELPVLGSVLFDATVGLTVVATDRYRLAVAPVLGAAADGPAVVAVVPVAVADQIVRVLRGADTADVEIAGGAITVRTGAAEAGGTLREDAFPDYARLLPAEGSGVPFEAAALRSLVEAAPTHRQVREQDGAEYAVAEIGIADTTVGVNREFLLQAVDAGGGGQLVLSLDGPVAPLVLRSERSTSLLMPVRL